MIIGIIKYTDVDVLLPKLIFQKNELSITYFKNRSYGLGIKIGNLQGDLVIQVVFGKLDYSIRYNNFLQ